MGKEKVREIRKKHYSGRKEQEIPEEELKRLWATDPLEKEAEQYGYDILAEYPEKRVSKEYLEKRKKLMEE
jgi:hypothetical protein